MIRAVIVGGGISGLTAGVALRRAGHLVHIYERSDLRNEVGAAINVPPNVSRFLTSWGLDPVRSCFVKAKVLEWCDPFTAEVKATISHEHNTTRFGPGAELWLAHRVDLHRALRHMAVDPEGPGTPVTLHPQSHVVRYDPDAPSVTLAGGQVIEADVVIGADGLHSAAAKAVLGPLSETTISSHYNYCYRFLIPASVLEADPETRFWNIDADGRSRVYADTGGQRRLVAYTCRDNTVHNFVGMYYDGLSKPGMTREDYQATESKLKVLQRFSGYHPSLLAVIDRAVDIRRWPLFHRPPNHTWRKGKLVLLGDAAHPMLPHQAQAGAQAMEDGAALGITLQGVATREEIEERLELYQEIRRTRASVVQVLSNVGADECHLVYDDLKEFLAEKDIPTNFGEINAFNYGYDVVKESLEAVRQLNKHSAKPPNRGNGTSMVADSREGLVENSQLVTTVH